ncbi:MAG: hypothetical protein AAFX50_25265 [Acidobacteriota bacterium]
MAQIVVENLEESVINRLMQRAHSHDRTLENEIRRILAEAVDEETVDFRHRSKALRDRLAGRNFPDPAELLALDRAR